MQTLYDTRTVRPLERYEHYRAGSAAELAPVSLHGPTPGRILAVMRVAKIGDFELAVVTWAADCDIVVRRTERLPAHAGAP